MCEQDQTQNLQRHFTAATATNDSGIWTNDSGMP